MKRKISILFEGEFEFTHKHDVGIYKIYFINSDKFYIGSTCSKNGFTGRWREHLHLLRNNKHTNRILQRTYNKYSESSLRLKIVEVCKNNTDYILEREQYYINSLKPDLNINLTAKGCTFPEGWVSPVSKAVLQYDLEGNYIREFKSISEAEREMKCDIVQALNNLSKFSTQAGNYQWRLKESNDFALKIPKYQYAQSKVILCYDSDGNFYKEFPSILSASKELNLECGNISKTINGLMRSYNGYFFKEKKSEEYPIHINDMLRLHKNQMFIDIEDINTGEKYHFSSMRQIPSNLLSRCSLQPYIKNGIKEFIFKRRVTGKVFKIKIQNYNKI